MARLPVKLRESTPRLPEQGRIKFGDEKPSETRPGKAIPWFRFCSQDRDALVQLARCSICGHGHHPVTKADPEGICTECETVHVSDGGVVKPWKNGYGRDWHQVTTRRSRMLVVLPPDPLGEGTWYEKWGRGSGCERRCDGETCTIPRGMDSDPNPEPIDIPCLCARAGALVCKPKTRLNVIIPGLDPFGGFWRLESGGDYAKNELPGMCEAVLKHGGAGMAYGFLQLDQRDQRTWEPGKDPKTGKPDPKTGKVVTHRFVTPIVLPATSFQGLLDGAARVRSLAAGSDRLALPPGDHHEAMNRFWAAGSRAEADGALQDAGHTVGDDGIEDAEVVEPEPDWFDTPAAPEGEDPNIPLGPPREEVEQWDDPDALDQAALDYEREKLVRAITWNLLNDTPLRHALVRRLTKGRTESTKDLTLEELKTLKLTGERIQRGELKPVLVDGEAIWG